MRVRPPHRWTCTPNALVDAIRRPAHMPMLWVYTVLARFAYADAGLVVKEMAHNMSYDDGLVSNWLKILCAFGLIRKETGPARGYVYAVLDEEPGPETLGLLRELAEGRLTTDSKHGRLYDAEGARIDLGRTSRTTATAVSDTATAVIGNQTTTATAVSDTATAVSADDDQNELTLMTTCTSDHLAVPGGPPCLIPRMFVLKGIGRIQEPTWNQTSEQPASNRGGTRLGSGRKASPVDPVAEPEVWAAWSYWRDQLYPNRTAPTTQDGSRLRARLRNGATLDEIKLIVDYAKQDPWLSGTKPGATTRYDTLEVLFNTEDKFLKYRDKAKAWQAGPKLDARGVDRKYREDAPPGGETRWW